MSEPTRSGSDESVTILTENLGQLATDDAPLTPEIAATPIGECQQPATVISNSEDLQKWSCAFDGAEILALDCEGVDLGREGTTSIVQLATMERCFVFDVMGKESESDIILFLKRLLEDESIIKIIHDCRVDSEVLFFHCGIRLTNVHDTQAWHTSSQEMKGKPRLNLNEMLEEYGCPQNETRDCNIYKENPRFWATRPITDAMIDWASHDVMALFSLRRRQIRRVGGAESALAIRCNAASAKYLSQFRDGLYKLVNIDTSRVGSFIGKGGRNLHQLEAETGASFCVNPPVVKIRAASATSMAIAVEKIQSFTHPMATDKVLIDPEKIGKLIGKGGANIKRLSSEIGASLHFDGEFVEISAENAQLLHVARAALSPYRPPSAASSTPLFRPPRPPTADSSLPKPKLFNPFYADYD